MACDPIDAALWYVRRGWPVFPCAWPVAGFDGLRCSCPKGAQCPRAAKHPWEPLVHHGLRDATVDPAVIRRWWTKAPHANVGLVQGEPAGRWVLDVDVKGNGLEQLAALEAELGALPPTLEAKTGSGGRHLIFRWPGRKVVTRVGSLGRGIDVRGDGGYIVAPPSVHASGGRYEWLDPRAAVRMAPVWLLERVMVAPEPLPLPAAPSSARRPIEAGRALRRAAAYARAYPAAIAGEGGHRQTFLLAVHLVKGFGLEAGEALQLLEEYSGRCTPQWSRRELVHKVESAMKSQARVGYLLERRSA